MLHKSIAQDIASAIMRANGKADAAAAALHYVGRLILFVGTEEMEELAAVAAAPSLALEFQRIGAVAPQLAFTTVAG